MPEPLSIATGVVALVFNCIKGLQVAKAYVDKYSNADLKLISLSTSCEALHEALRQITDILTSESLQSILRDDSGGGRTSLERFEKVFSNCALVFSIIHGRVSPLLEPTFDTDNTIENRSRVAAVWNDPNIDSLISLVRDLTPAVSLLFNAFTAKTFIESHKILTTPKAKKLFQHVDSETQSLYTSHRENSIISRTTANGAETIVDDGEIPTLNDILADTRPYRRMLLQASLRQEAEDRLNGSSQQGMADGRADALSVAHSAPSVLPSGSGRAGRRSLLGAILRNKPSHRPPNTTDHLSPESGPHQASLNAIPGGSVSMRIESPPAADPWEQVRTLVAGNRRSLPVRPEVDSYGAQDEVLDAQARRLEELLR